MFTFVRFSSKLERIHRERSVPQTILDGVDDGVGTLAT